MLILTSEENNLKLSYSVEGFWGDVVVNSASLLYGVQIMSRFEDFGPPPDLWLVLFARHMCSPLLIILQSLNNSSLLKMNALLQTKFRKRNRLHSFERKENGSPIVPSPILPRSLFLHVNASCIASHCHSNPHYSSFLVVIHVQKYFQSFIIIMVFIFLQLYLFKWPTCLSMKPCIMQSP